MPLATDKKNGLMSSDIYARLNSSYKMAMGILYHFTLDGSGLFVISSSGAYSIYAYTGGNKASIKKITGALSAYHLIFYKDPNNESGDFYISLSETNKSAILTSIATTGGVSLSVSSTGIDSLTEYRTDI